MIEFLSAPGNTVFAAALVLMLLVGAVEVIELGGSAIDLDLDADADAGAQALAWLGVGRVPLLVLLVVYLAIFGIAGLMVQRAALAFTGDVLPVWLAVPGVALAALPVTSIAARGLARVLPRDETTAIDIDDLVGRAATIVTGRAVIGSAARARALDRHGQGHFVMVEPNAASEEFAEGDTVLLIRREGHVFRAIARGRRSAAD